MTKQQTYAYIRVSSKEQNVARQVATMKQQGVNDNNVYIDKISGKNTERPNYQALKLEVKPFDTVIFDSISRMSRNMNDIENEYKWFTERNISLMFIKEPMINYDVNKVEDDPVMAAIPKMVLTLLSAFAEKERIDIKERQKEGIKAAKKQGVKFGRPSVTYESLTTDDKQLFRTQYRRWKNKEQTAVQTMKNVDLKKTTFYKIVREYEELMTD